MGGRLNLLHAILLGIIQGLTEFLPISSTAHLTLTGKLFGLIDPQHPESWTAFIAVIQLGTLAAVIIYFFRDVMTMITSFLSDLRQKGVAVTHYSEKSRLGLYIVLGTLPVAIIGLSLKKIIEGMFTKSTLVIVASLVALAALLWLAEKVARHSRTMSDVRWWDALVIGVAQALALIPGSSRSGTTMTAGLFLGLAREAAARFSFLLSIPAVLASGIYEMSKIQWDSFEFGTANLIVATIVSAVSGYAAIAWLLRYLMKNTTMVFVWYRFGLGILLTILLLRGLIEP